MTSQLASLQKRIHDGSATLTIIGLGYVGLPLAVAFGKHFRTLGFDLDAARIDALKSGIDRTREVTVEELKAAKHLDLTDDPSRLNAADGFIITVPTPIDTHRQPDLTPLLNASRTVGRALRPGGIVIFESTVYPGCTEEDCVPILEHESGLRFNRDFYCGYSPERINPGDKQHTLSRILKITSGSTQDAARVVDALYRTIIEAGTHQAPSIKVAEAAKVIENAQRDINIAFVNELAMIFSRLGLDTHDVLAAAGTKWNFLPFKPGLVGGHCIGVDPYYLTQKAQQVGYHPEIILAGRRLNDNMGAHVAQRVVKLMIRKGLKVEGARVLILGLTFKENCPDIRNSRVPDVIRELNDFGCRVDVHDPQANPEDVRLAYGLDPIALTEVKAADRYDAVILAVAHREFISISPGTLLAANGVLFDIKGFFPRDIVDDRL